MEDNELVTPPDLQKRLKPKSTKLTNPVTDIVDAYFIAKWGWEGFLLIGEYMKDLSELIRNMKKYMVINHKG